MSVCADANITGTFLHFWTHKVHYELKFIKVNYKISTTVAFCPYTGAALSGLAMSALAIMVLRYPVPHFQSPLIQLRIIFRALIY